MISSDNSAIKDLSREVAAMLAAVDDRRQYLCATRELRAASEALKIGFVRYLESRDHTASVLKRLDEFEDRFSKRVDSLVYRSGAPAETAQRQAVTKSEGEESGENATSEELVRLQDQINVQRREIEDLKAQLTAVAGTVMKRAENESRLYDSIKTVYSSCKLSDSGKLC